MPNLSNWPYLSSLSIKSIWKQSKKKNSFSWNKFQCGPILYSDWCRFHGVSMLVTCCWVCWFSLLVRNLHDNSMGPAWNLHGTSMKTASVRRRHATITFRHKKQRLPTWNLHETYINSPWNLHGNSIKEDAIQAPGVDTGNMFETFF